MNSAVSQQVSGLDRRLNAYRDDLADVNLKGRVEAARFVEPVSMQVKVHFADVLDRPEEKGGLQTQFLYGHQVRMFDGKDGWAWVQGEDCGYVGYVREECLCASIDSPLAATHMVRAPRTFLYCEPDLVRPRTGYRSIGSRLTVTDTVTVRGTDYVILESGDAVIAKHVFPIGEWQTDPVAVAETLLHTPYLWGGNTGFGIDCSGLVLIANMACGQSVLRDSDMQAQSVGERIETDFTNLQRGDLVFWKAHVGIMTDRDHLLHANGNTMNVALERLDEAIERIGYLYGPPTLVRRPEQG